MEDVNLQREISPKDTSIGLEEALALKNVGELYLGGILPKVEVIKTAKLLCDSHEDFDAYLTNLGIDYRGSWHMPTDAVVALNHDENEPLNPYFNKEA